MYVLLTSAVCVLLEEIIDICAEAFYAGNLSPPHILEVYLIELIKFATMLVESSFDNMFRQNDGIAMGSPLGPVIANILVAFH